MAVRFIIIADDENLSDSPIEGPFDVLISCGDLPDRVILETAERVRCSRIFAVKGNHDTGAPFPAPIIDMHQRIVDFEGLIFGGFQGAWKYKPRGHFLYEQHEVSAAMESFPRVDVFVAHNSPRHVHDREDDVHTGFEAFATYIRRARPRVFFHGHQHINRETPVDATKVIGIYGTGCYEI